MVTQFDEWRIEEVAREHSLVGLIERERHKPPFPREVWNHFHLLDGGRGQMIGEYTPAYERAYAEAVKYLQDSGVLTTVDDGAYIVLGSNNDVFSPQTPDGETLYFVNKRDAEQYSHLWAHSGGRGLRVRKLSSG